MGLTQDQEREKLIPPIADEDDAVYLDTWLDQITPAEDVVILLVNDNTPYKAAKDDFLYDSMGNIVAVQIDNIWRPYHMIAGIHA